MPSYGLGGSQLNALYGLGRRRIPYDAYIESRIPSLYTRKKYQEDKELAQNQLALDTEALNLSEKELEESTRQSNERLALEKEQMDQAAKDAKTGQAIQLGQLGILGGYVGHKAGLGKKLFGIGAEPTDATGDIPVAEVGTGTGTGTGVLGQVPAAVDMGVALGPEAMGETLSYIPELAYPEAAATSPGLTTTSMLGPAAALAAWSAFVGGAGDPIMNPIAEGVGGVLGMGKTAPSSWDWINAYLSGAEPGTSVGHGQTMPENPSDSMISHWLTAGYGSVPEEVLGMIKNRDIQGLTKAGAWNPDTGIQAGALQNLIKQYTKPEVLSPYEKRWSDMGGGA